jgi:hypothetical protein
MESPEPVMKRDRRVGFALPAMSRIASAPAAFVKPGRVGTREVKQGGEFFRNEA